MKLNQKLFAGGAAVLIGTLGLGGAAMAANTGASANPRDSLIQKIADKFKLNKSEVQQVFDENREEMKQKHEQKLKDRIGQAVKDGKITQEQADKLLAKLTELHEQKKADTKEDRRDNRQAAHDELEKWAKENDINLSEVLPRHDGPRGHHRGQ